MIKNIFGVMLGLLVIIVSTLVLNRFASYIIILVIPPFLGGFVSGYICKNKNWIYGGLTGIIFVLLILISDFHLRKAGSVAIVTIKSILIPLSFIGVSIFGGFIGGKLNRKNKLLTRRSSGSVPAP